MIALIASHAINGLVSLPTPHLCEKSLDRLIQKQLLVQRNFLEPELVSALVADMRSLQARGGDAPSAAASTLHGSVEWRMLLPDGPTNNDGADPLGLQGRETLLCLVTELASQIESRTGVALDVSQQLAGLDRVRSFIFAEPPCLRACVPPCLPASLPPCLPASLPP